jgi:N-acetylmuramoyl-L-alanine amidase
MKRLKMTIVREFMKSRCLCVLITAVLAAAVTSGCVSNPEPTVRPAPVSQPPVVKPQHPIVTEPAEPGRGAGVLFGKTIVIDAGHGGKDPGAMFRAFSRLSEKTINLDIARRLKGVLEESGAHVIMTRDGDEFIELEERAEISNRVKADLFIAIHTNSNPKRQISGITVYVERNAYPRTESIARRLVKSLETSGFECIGVHEQDYKVLKNNQRPAVLVECGFITNRSDAEKLNDAEYRQRLAAGLARGIAFAFNRR